MALFVLPASFSCLLISVFFWPAAYVLFLSCLCVDHLPELPENHHPGKSWQGLSRPSSALQGCDPAGWSCWFMQAWWRDCKFIVACIMCMWAQLVQMKVLLTNLWWVLLCFDCSDSMAPFLLHCGMCRTYHFLKPAACIIYFSFFLLLSGADRYLSQQLRRLTQHSKRLSRVCHRHLSQLLDKKGRPSCSAESNWCWCQAYCWAQQGREDWREGENQSWWLVYPLRI